MESDSDDECLKVVIQNSASVHGFAGSACHIGSVHRNSLHAASHHYQQTLVIAFTILPEKMLPKRADSLKSLSSRTSRKSFGRGAGNGYDETKSNLGRRARCPDEQSNAKYNNSFSFRSNYSESTAGFV